MSSDRRSTTVIAIQKALHEPVLDGLKKIEALEGKLSAVFAGQPVTQTVIPDILKFCEHEIPSPDGFRWQVDVIGDRVCPYLERESGYPEGYRYGGRITTGFDGGNHSLKGDLLQCKRCASLVPEGDHRIHTGDHQQADRLDVAVTAVDRTVGLLASRVFGPA